MFHRITILILSLLIPCVSFSWELVQEETPVLPLTSVTKTIWKQVVEPRGEYDVVSINRYRNTEVATIAAVFFLILFEFFFSNCNHKKIHAATYRNT